MVALDKYTGGSTLPQVRQPRVVADTAVGQALQGFGQDVASAGANVGNALAQRQQQRDDFQRRKGLLDFQAQNLEAETNLQQNIRPMADGYEADALADFDKRSQTFLESMPEGAREQASLDIQRMRNQFQGRAKATEIKERNRYYRNEIATSQDNLLQGLRQDPDSYDDVVTAGRTLINGSELVAAEKQERIQEWERLAALAWAQDLPPEERQRLFGSGRNQGGDYFAAIRQAESGGNDAAKNPKSSATGRYQFTKGTWDQLRRNHPELNLTADGRLDPDQQERAIRVFTAENAASLRDAGIEATNGNLYAAHFLGAGGARTVLASDDATKMSEVVSPGVIQANPFLRSMTVGDFRAWTDRKAGGDEATVLPEIQDRVQALSYEDTVRLGDQADRDMVRVAADVSDAYRLGIQVAPHEITVEDIVSDPVLDNGQKASLVKELRSVLKQGQEERDAVNWVSGGLNTGNPYSAADRKLAQDAFTAFTRGGTEEDIVKAGQGITESTGVVPKGYVDYLRGGLISTNQNDVYHAAQQSYRLMQSNPRAVEGAQNGSELSTAAAKFDFYNNELGLSPAETGKRLAASNDPEAINARKALMQSPEVVAELKKVDASYVASEASVGTDRVFDVKLGDTPAAAAVMTAEYKELLEEGIYQANGDIDLGKKLARDWFNRWHFGSEYSTTGPGTVLKYPVERTYPSLPDGSHDYLRDQVIAGLAEDGIETDEVYFQVMGRETEAAVNAGAAPPYQVYYEKDGELQLYNFPFRGDYDSALKAYQLGAATAVQEGVARSRQERDENLERRFFGREDSLDAFIEGPGRPGPEQTVPEAPEEPRRGATANRRQRRQEQIERMQSGDAEREAERLRAREEEEALRRALEEQRRNR